MVWKEAGEGSSIAVVGDIYRFLASGEDTDGRYALWHATVTPGGGPPSHIHTREAESFYVLEGEVTFYLEGDRRRAGPGAFILVPIGTLHTFKNETSEPATMLITVSPAGLEKMFVECGVSLPPGVTTAAPPTQEEIERLLSVAPKYGVEIVLPL